MHPADKPGAPATNPAKRKGVGALSLMNHPSYVPIVDGRASSYAVHLDPRSAANPQNSLVFSLLYHDIEDIFLFYTNQEINNQKMLFLPFKCKYRVLLACI